MSVLIDVEHLIKEYRRETTLFRRSGTVRAVDDVSFTISEKTIFGLVGESGCGKTTLARGILFLDPPTSGNVSYKGVSLNTCTRKELYEMRLNMQIVYQHPQAALNPRMRLKAILEEPLLNRGFPKKKRSGILHESLKRVGLDPTGINKYPYEFSGGQRQRIVIARALEMEPEFLVLDEPVSNLDVSIQAQIINLLYDLKRKFSLTYLFISHDLNLIAYVSDWIGVMYQGRIVELADAEKIIHNALHPYTGKLFASRPGFRRKDSGLTIDTDHTVDSTGCPFSQNCQFVGGECFRSIPSLQKARPDHLVACRMICRTSCQASYHGIQSYS